MAERFMRKLFASDEIVARSFVVLVNPDGRHIVANVLYGEGTGEVADKFRGPTDLGAYAINVKTKVKP